MLSNDESYQNLQQIQSEKNESNKNQLEKLQRLCRARVILKYNERKYKEALQILEHDIKNITLIVQIMKMNKEHSDFYAILANKITNNNMKIQLKIFIQMIFYHQNV